MFKNKLREDSPVPKFLHLKIQSRDGIESLTTLEEGEFEVPIDGCIKIKRFWIVKADSATIEVLLLKNFLKQNLNCELRYNSGFISGKLE